MGKDLTSGDMFNRLSVKYGDGGRYAVFAEVANGTGGRCSSWIDAAVVHLWPSDGCVRKAFEIKVSRGDFLNELSRPGKNEWARLCFHEFWYLAPKGIIKEEELPEGCGLMITHGKGLRVVRAASRKENPECCDSLIASFARSAQRSIGLAAHRSRESILEDSHEYKEGVAWKKATQKFLQSHGIPKYDCPTHADFEKACSDKRNVSDAERLVQVADLFKDDMMGVAVLALALAHKSSIARDEMGKYPFSRYSIQAEAGVEIAGKIKNGRDAIAAQVEEIMSRLSQQGKRGQNMNNEDIR